MLFLHLVFAASLASAQSTSSNFVICKLHGNVRTIQVKAAADGGFQTIYSKDGNDKVIGSGRNKDSCLHFLQNVRTNLEKSGWKCRDVANATATESPK